MRRALLITAVVAVLAGGAWFALRNGPSVAPLDEAGGGFKLEPAPPGRLFTMLDSQIPLRALHWLQPLPGGVVVAQLVTQTDRQELILFREGQPPATFRVGVPQGVTAGFWRFAVLKDAALAQGGAAVLLYQGGDGEAAVAVALDTTTQAVRWAHRGAFARMALTEAGDAVYLFGGKGPIQRLQMAASGGQARTIEPAPDMGAVEDLLPTGPVTFLASHGKGLSAYGADQAWTHFPGPEDHGVPCQGWTSSLTRAGHRIWWQPAPGGLLEVRGDGTAVGPWTPQGFAAEDANGRDARLLRILGADPGGALWFDLATPVAMVAPPPPPPAQEPSSPEEAAVPPAPAPEPWGPYVAQGLGRIYRLRPDGKTLDRLAWNRCWGALTPPPEIPPPGPGQPGRPAGNGLLVEGPRRAWWLPLSALPLQAVQAR